MNDLKYFFNEYGYKPTNGFETTRQQLKKVGVDIDGCQKFSAGYGNCSDGSFQEGEYTGSYMTKDMQLKGAGINTDYTLEYGKGYKKVGGGDEPEPNYLTFTAVEDNSSVGFYYWVGPAPGTSPDLGKNMEYSLDNGETWETYTIVNVYNNMNWINLEHAGDSVMFRGNNETLRGEGYNSTKCDLQGKVAASGDITSLLNGVGGDIPIPESCFSMFFFYEDALTSAPNLPSTQLSGYCYSSMFLSCTSLTKAPVLPATKLSDSCYVQMFWGCTSLNEVTCLATDISAENCTRLWLDNVSQTGTFTKVSGMNDWTTGINGIPEGWAVQVPKTE